MATKKKTTSKKVVKKNIKKVSKPVKKETSKVKTDVSKKAIESKVDAVKHKTNVSKKYKKKYDPRDIATIVVLGLLIIAIILVAILFPEGTNTNPTDPTIIDENVNDVNDFSELTLEEFEQRALEFQTNLFSEIKQAQLEILNSYFTELGINEEEMNQCLLENDYTSSDLDTASAEIILKITDDITQASVLGLTGTPGIYVSGYKLPGYVDYNSFKEVIDIAMQDPTISFDYNKTYVSDINSNPKVYIITNENNQTSKQNTTEFLESLEISENLTPEVKEFFTEIINSFDTTYLSYETEDAKNLIEANMIDSVPAIYVEGNIKSSEVYDENFEAFFKQIFIETKTKGYLLNPMVMTSLVDAGNYKYVNKIIDDAVLYNPKDYVIGNKESGLGVYVFTDYDCPYCKLFEQDTQDSFIEEYVDTNQAYLVIKDFVVHEMSAIFPAVFSRCAEKQGVYLETHRLLFSLKDELGQEAVVSPILEKYKDETEFLNKEYQRLLEEQEQ